MLGAMACALVMVTACKSGTVGENTNDSTKQIETTDETQLTDEQWREQWLNGELLDLTKSERNYAAILRNDIDTSTPYNIVEQYYPRSVEEMNILYDSIDIHCNFDNPYENRYNMIYHVLYMNAYRNSQASDGCQPIQMLGHSMNAVSIPKGGELTFDFTVEKEGDATLYTAMIPTQPNDKGCAAWSGAEADAC